MKGKGKKEQHRQTDGQTDRQTYIHTDIQAGRQIDINKQRQRK